MAVAHAGGREASLFYGKISGSSPNMERILRRIMKQHRVSREDVLIGYEAGPCGFVLATLGVTGPIKRDDEGAALYWVRVYAFVMQDFSLRLLKTPR